ncbi:MAG: L-histidine N(alpha)-methyltransferase, partial [Henriciella sp.]
FDFAGGETIHTENSRKISRAAFARMAKECGWRLERTWMDDDEYFAVMLLGAD